MYLADIVDRTCKGPNSEREQGEALEPLLHEREQGAQTSEPRENCVEVTPM
jgi:hypothetical protein